MTVLVLLPLCLAGCGGQSVQGTVTLDGQPLQDGYIAFLPEKNTKGPGAGAPIQAGKFVIGKSHRPLEGVYRVEITAKGQTGRKTVDGSGQRRSAEGQILPSRYNKESTLTAEVKRRQENELVFDLTSK